ncbi:helix-turn-helix domain-containing protein [Neobacillus sp. NPDC093127]|uniref:helix-turn-helix domain-containing protein n=1 Tax=Neobacillus sp. NPDC093127 TaxID=3364296 RepID=UPI00381B7C44
MQENTNPLFVVFTSREAAERWGLSENTVTQWCNRGRFEAHEARKSGKVWLVTKEGMERLTDKREEKKMTVTFEGKEITLTQDPYIDGVPGREPYYRAVGIDAEGNEYNVVWNVVDNYEEIEDESEMVADWGKPFDVIKL